MLPDRRAVVFALDDTLYPHRRFVLSGLAAVAGHLELWHGIPARRALRALARASYRAPAGTDPLSGLRGLQLSPARLALLGRVFDRHEPSLKLPPVTRRLLSTLRDQRWLIGVLTNGPKARQARRVRLLGLPALVDAVVFASDHGSGRGKPEPAPFFEIARRLDVPPGRVVVVGDDEVCDVGGAMAAGMRPVRCDVWSRLAGSTRAALPTDAPLTLRSFSDLPLAPPPSHAEVLTQHVA